MNTAAPSPENPSLQPGSQPAAHPAPQAATQSKAQPAPQPEAQPSSPPVLRLEGATKEFFRKGRAQAGTFAAVSDVDLALYPGRLVACMGRSGSGKTTLLNMMAGLLEPTRGSIVLDGTDLYCLDDARLSRLRNASIGVVPQGQTPVHSLTLLQNVMLPATMYKGQGSGGAPSRAHDAQALEAHAMDLLKQVGLVPLIDSYPAELSGGELRRMAIVRALAAGPRLVLADEPTGDLDEANTALVLQLLRQAADNGAAVFVVTHDQEVLAYADAVVRMDAGHLASTDEPASSRAMRLGRPAGA